MSESSMLCINRTTGDMLEGSVLILLLLLVVAVVVVVVFYVFFNYHQNFQITHSDIPYLTRQVLKLFLLIFLFLQLVGQGTSCYFQQYLDNL